MLQWTSKRPLRILYFDLENRPLSYRGGDYTSAEVTIIAAGWSLDKIESRALTTRKDSMVKMLKWFVKLYDQADMVSGHFIRRHDLPMINGALMECGLPILQPKLTSDTYLDLTSRKDLSASLESLAGMLGVLDMKPHLSQHEWRMANRLAKEGIDIALNRGTEDVRITMKVRDALIEGGYLKSPRIWRP